MTHEIPEAWRETLDRYFAYLNAMGYAQATIASRRSHLNRLAVFCDSGPATITTGDLIAALARCRSRAYKKSARNAFSSFFKWYSGIERGRTDNPVALLPAIRKIQPNPTPCPDDAIRSALRKGTAEERLMILLAAECGLRRGEIAQVSSRDVVDDSSGRKSLIIHGKGDKQRIVPLPDDLAEAILAANGYVFRGRFGGHVEVSYVGKHISRLLPEGYTAHKLRHRFATKAYAESHDMLGVCKALGHASTETTMAYTALPDERLRGLVDATTMTEQPERQPERTSTAEVHSGPLPSAQPVPDVAEQVRRHANGKIHYGYENGHGERRRAPRRTAGSSPHAIRAAMLLAAQIGHDVFDLGARSRSFAIPAESFAERHRIKPDGHARRSSTLRAGARLMQERGLIELKSTKDGTISGNLTAGAQQLEDAISDYAAMWCEMQDGKES